MNAEPAHHGPHQRSAIVAAASVFVLHTLLRVAVVLGPGMGGPMLADETRFHAPVIETFAEAWPSPDLDSYHAASTPGHHLVCALIVKVLDPSLDALRILSGTPISVLLGLLVWWCARRVGPLAAVALIAPLACSPYTAAFSTLVLPESSSWLLVGMILCLVCSRKFGYASIVLAGGLLLFSVGVRQISLWLAAPIWVAAWFGAAPVAQDVSRVIPTPIWPPSAMKTRVLHVAIAAACTLPAFALLAWFMQMWGGLVPPPFQSDEAASAVGGAVANQGVSPAAGAFLLAILGVVGTFFAPVVLPIARERWRSVLRWGLVGAGFACVISLAVPTSYNQDAGRWSGLWNIAAKLPVIADRSLFIIGSAMVGGFIVGGLVVTLNPVRTRWILLASVVAAIAAHTSGAQLFQRYMDPIVLILLPLAVACAYERHRDTPSWWTLLAPLLLGLALFIVETVPNLGAGP